MVSESPVPSSLLCHRVHCCSPSCRYQAPMEEDEGEQGERGSERPPTGTLPSSQWQLLVESGTQHVSPAWPLYLQQGAVSCCNCDLPARSLWTSGCTHVHPTGQPLMTPHPSTCRIPPQPTQLTRPEDSMTPATHTAIRVFRSRLLEASRKGAPAISFLAISNRLSRGEAAKAFYQVCGELSLAGR